MCEINAYFLTEGLEEKLLMSSVDTVCKVKDGEYELTGIFGDRIFFKGTIEFVNLLDHKILFHLDH